MSAAPVHTVIVCEDLQHEVFVRRFLRDRGWGTRQIRAQKAPAGSGSAEQWVRQRLPSELRAYRDRSSRATTNLIVVMDADTGTVEQHTRELQQACRDAGLEPPAAGERVLFVIPRRNIETWLAYLRGEAVDEQTAYPKYQEQSDCKKDVDALSEMCRGQRPLSQGVPLSLLTVCDEYKRLGL